jgi:uncharacterized protein YndB with AHSA1/START domain
MPTIDAAATTTAPPEAVWTLLEDASAWSRWGSWKDVHVEGGGPQQPGAIRVLVRPPFRVRERITAWEPGRRMGYELVSGMHVRGYHATATLEPDAGGGTSIRWHSEYASSDPVTALILRLAVRDTVKRLAKAAGR